MQSFFLDVAPSSTSCSSRSCACLQAKQISPDLALPCIAACVSMGRLALLSDNKAKVCALHYATHKVEAVLVQGGAGAREGCRSSREQHGCAMLRVCYDLSDVACYIFKHHCTCCAQVC